VSNFSPAVARHTVVRICQLPIVEMPGTTIKAALEKFEVTTGVKPSEASEIKMIGVYPYMGRT
jgi:hypothetical protein